MISSTGRCSARKRVQASYCARQQSGGVGCSSRSREQLLELLRVIVRPAGAEGERHRRARVLRRRFARIGEPRGVRLRRDRVIVGAARAGADEDELLDEVRMAERNGLGEVAAHREARDVRPAALERLGGVVGHLLDRVRPGWLGRAARAAVLDCDAAEALRPGRELALPRPDRVAEAGEQQQRLPVAVLLPVEPHATALRSRSRAARPPMRASVTSRSAASSRMTASTPAWPPTARP